VKSEDNIIRDILKLQKMLMKEHKTASLFSCSSKFGLLHFGSDHTVDKFKGDLFAWETVFEEDDNDIAHGVQVLGDDEDDALNDLKVSLLPKKLPASIQLMSYDELWT
jgi:hypothetical protein